MENSLLCKQKLMANYNLETETTVHIKGATINASGGSTPPESKIKKVIATFGSQQEHQQYDWDDSRLFSADLRGDYNYYGCDKCYIYIDERLPSYVSFPPMVFSTTFPVYMDVKIESNYGRWMSSVRMMLNGTYSDLKMCVLATPSLEALLEFAPILEISNVRQATKGYSDDYDYTEFYFSFIEKAD